MNYQRSQIPATLQQGSSTPQRPKDGLHHSVQSFQNFFCRFESWKFIDIHESLKWRPSHKTWDLCYAGVYQIQITRYPR